MKPLAVLCILLAVCFPLHAGEIEDALRSVRDNKADMYARESTTFGQLPSPAEQAGQQRRARPILRPVRRPELDLDGAVGKQMLESAKAFVADLKKVKSRNAGPIPMGISGAVIHDLQGHAGFYVLRVLPGTPAVGGLRQKDVVLGANGRLFTHAPDPRPELGFELAASQSPELKGQLTLHLVRGAKPMTVRIDLGESDYYSKTYPRACAKTRRMAREAVDVVLHQSRKGVDIFTRLFLLSSRDDEAIMQVRNELYRKLVAPDDYAAHVSSWGNSWIVSYNLIALTEYYLMTGDAAVLRTIKASCRVLERQQFESGSWSHGKPGGYGEINNVGAAAFVGLVLARECGVEVNERILARAIRFFGSYCGGSLFYGVDLPVGRGGTNDNGMPAMCAVAFHILGEKDMASRWAQTMSYKWMVRQKGHAEATFNMFWQPIGASLGPKPIFRMFMDQNIWMHELSRTPDRGFVFFRGGRVGYPANITATVGSFLFLEGRPLRIMGGQKGAMSMPAPVKLAKARMLLLGKKWSAARAAVTASGAADSSYAKALVAKLDWVETHVDRAMAVIDKDVKCGRVAIAAERLDDLICYYGREPKGAGRVRTLLAKADAKAAAPQVATVFDVSGLGAGLQFEGAFGEDAEALNRHGFEGLTSREVARFLGHCHTYVFNAAVQTLAERGENHTDLIKKMIKDRHPYVRSGAIALLRESILADCDDKDKPVLTPVQRRTFVDTVRPLLNDSHQDVQLELVASVKAFGSHDAELSQAMLRIAQSGVLVARLKLVNALGQISDDKIRFDASRAILRSALPAARSNGYSNCMQIAAICGYDWNAADLSGFKLPPEGLAILNDMAYHGRYVLRGPRGYSDILVHLAAGAWSPEVEQLEHMVPALTQLFVRSKEGSNWIAYDVSRFVLRELFHHVDKKRLRAALEAEKAWLAEAPDECFVEMYCRASCEKSIAEVEQILAGKVTDRPAVGLPIKKIITNAPAIPIALVKDNNSQWAQARELGRHAYMRKRRGADSISAGCKRTGKYPGGIDMLAIQRAIRDTGQTAGFDVSRMVLGQKGEKNPDYHKIDPNQKYMFLVSVATPRLRFSFGTKFVCLGDAIIFDARDYNKKDTPVVQPGKPGTLCQGGFYCSFMIPDGVREGSPAWNALVEKEVSQAFYEQILVPFAKSIQAPAAPDSGVTKPHRSI